MEATEEDMVVVRMLLELQIFFHNLKFFSGYGYGK